MYLWSIAAQGIHFDKIDRLFSFADIFILSGLELCRRQLRRLLELFNHGLIEILIVLLRQGKTKLESRGLLHLVGTRIDFAFTLA